MFETLTMWIETVLSTPLFYPSLALLVFLDSVLPALPSEFVLTVSGAWAGARDQPNVVILALVGIVTAIVGDCTLFSLAQRLQHFVNDIPRSSKHYSKIVWVRRNIREKGGLAIIVGRFVPGARWFLVLILGSMRYPWRSFVFFDSMAVLLWAGQTVGVGYLSGMAFHTKPLLGMVISVPAAFLAGWLLQRLSEAWTDWREIRRAYARPH